MIVRALVFASLVPLLLTAIYDLEGEQASTSPAKPLTLKEVWALDATYTDQQHGVTFRYPSVWKAAMQVGYHPPALTESDVAKPIAGFGYEEGSFPRDHIVGPYTANNLEGFGIVYSAIPAVNASACEATASSIVETQPQTQTPEHRPVIFNGRSFSEYHTGEEGMSQSTSGRLYAIYVRPTCYLFETDVAVSSAALEEIAQALSPDQMRFIEDGLLKIMKSVHIAQSGR
jgi:hypothetical protein